jgi:signal transduction histidine kinase
VTGLETARSAHAHLGIEMGGALVVPLVFRGRALGVLSAIDRAEDGPGFHPEDERLLLAFAASAATAVATAQSVEADRLRFSLESAELERRRWARELHDETLQGMGALRVLLGSALRAGSEQALRDAVSNAMGQLGDDIRNLRALITELRPASLDELGLAPALETLAERTGAAYDLEVALEMSLAYERGDLPTRLIPELESAAYRLVQEALNNAARHALADHVTIEIAESDGALSISVSDNGRGFDVDSYEGGFGLTGMRERVALVGGRIEIVSNSGGTTVTAELPAEHLESD